MARQRSILSLILGILATFIVSCGSPTVAKVPPTYTAAQVEQIQQYVPKIVGLRDRATSELQRLIQNRDWINVSDFIHGPLGELRLQMIYVTRNLLPQDQDKARQATRKFFDDLVTIDQAAQKGEYQRAARNYREALGDIDAFLELVPKSSPLAQA
jgi:photosystem II protein PsbQ